MSTDTVGVVFDMDGVLIDSSAHHRAAWAALLDEMGVARPPEFWRMTIGRPAEEAVALLLGVALSSWEARELATRKRAHYIRFARRGVLPVTGVVDFVASVRAAELPCAVATSASRMDVSRLLYEVGLAGRFDAIITADDVRLGKPHPDVYTRAAEAIGADARRCLAFEDSVVGVHSARGAGMTVIGVTTSHTSVELAAAGATRSIESFEGLRWPV